MRIWLFLPTQARRVILPPHLFHPFISAKKPPLTSEFCQFQSQGRLENLLQYAALPSMQRFHSGFYSAFPHAISDSDGSAQPYGHILLPGKFHLESALKPSLFLNRAFPGVNHFYFKFRLIIQIKFPE